MEQQKHTQDHDDNDYLKRAKQFQSHHKQLCSPLGNIDLDLPLQVRGHED